MIYLRTEIAKPTSSKLSKMLLANADDFFQNDLIQSVQALSSVSMRAVLAYYFLQSF